jgi:hypothetical protein
MASGAVAGAEAVAAAVALADAAVAESIAEALAALVTALAVGTSPAGLAFGLSSHDAQRAAIAMPTSATAHLELPR